MSPSSSRTRNVFEPLDRSFVADLWERRFGIPESIFSGYVFFQKARSVWAANDAVLPRLSYEAIGMRIMNLKDRPWKPTTNALQVFGRHATKNFIHISSEEAISFLEGKTIALKPQPESGFEFGQEPGVKFGLESGIELGLESDIELGLESGMGLGLESGYVVVFYRGEVLGCGLYSHGMLASQIPKERRLASIPQNDLCCCSMPKEAPDQGNRRPSRIELEE